MFALILNRTFRWHPVALWRMETWRKLWGNRKSSISSVNVPSLFYSWKKTTNTKDAVFVLVFLFLLPRLHSKQTLLLEMREKVHIPMASSPPPTHIWWKLLAPYLTVSPNGKTKRSSRTRERHIQTHFLWRRIDERLCSSDSFLSGSWARRCAVTRWTRSHTCAVRRM